MTTPKRTARPRLAEGQARSGPTAEEWPPSRAGRPKGSKNKVKRGGKRRGRKPGPKGQSELHEMIRGALKSSSAPMRVADIAKKVLAGGYKSKSKVFPLIVGQRLAEMKDVKRPERGLYTMK